MVDMDTIVSLCKRRGFIFQSSEIYGGLGSTWDYGPLGVELKRNVKEAWWNTVVRRRADMVGLDAAILMHPRVWEASGHVAGFADPMVDCRQCKQRFRADHLENLEALREAVYLRSYGQKNPLTEYKLEGFDIFYRMLDDIRLEIASRVFLVKIKVEGEAAPVRQVRQVTGSAQHSAVSTFNDSGTSKSPTSARSGQMSAANPDNVTVVRSVPKVGRNEQCPCGSGKKYKHCHGA
jgi:hypothetical protein